MIKHSLSGIFAVLLLTQPLLADDPKEIDDLKECRSVAGDKERLLCYDTVLDGGVFNQKKVQTENFGSTKSQTESSVDKLIVTIVRIQESENGTHYFYTADEQVWKQTNRGNWSLDVPIQAEIKSGMMNSFFLVTEGGKSTRVKRVQ